MARDVFQHHDRIVDDEAGRDGERHQRQIVEAVAQEIHRPERADQRDRHGDGGDERRPAVAQEDEDHEDDQRHGDQQRALDIMQRGADRRRAVIGDGDVDVARDRRLELGQQRLDAVDGVDDVGAGLAEQDHQHRAPAVGDALVAQILHRIVDFGDVGQAHRRAIAIGHDEVAILAGGARLVVGVDLVAVLADIDRAFRAVGVGRGEGGTDILQADPVFEEGARVDLDPDGRQRRAADLHLADAGDLRQFLLHHRRGGIVELALRQGGGGQRQDEDRRVGGIDLAIGRVAAKRGRQVGMRRVDRRLNVAGGAVDIAVEAELQRDLGRADRARRGHLGDVGDLAEMAFERRRHAGRHRLRAGAGQRRLHRDGRVIDLRQRRDRQPHIGHHAGERHAERQERGGDRAPDEGFGEIHSAGAWRVPPSHLLRAQPPSRSKPR